MKKKVLVFFALLLAFALVLLIIQKIEFGRFAGFSIISYGADKVEGKMGKDFLFKIQGLEKTDQGVKISSKIEELSGKDQVLDISIKLSAEDGKEINTKRQTIFLEKLSCKKYNLLYPVGNIDGKYIMQIELSNGNQVQKNEQEVLINSPKVTGFAVINLVRTKGQSILFLVFSFLVLTLTFRFIFDLHRRNSQHASLGERINKRFIPIDLD